MWQPPVRIDHAVDGIVSVWDPNAAPDALAGVVIGPDNKVLWELRLRNIGPMMLDGFRNKGLLDGQLIDGNSLVRNALESSTPDVLPIYVRSKKTLLTSALKDQLEKLMIERGVPGAKVSTGQEAFRIK